jgi:hypothetical protein
MEYTQIPFMVFRKPAFDAAGIPDWPRKFSDTRSLFVVVYRY